MRTPIKESGKRLFEKIVSVGSKNNLYRLSNIYRTDKGSPHNYIPHYVQHFSKYKNRTFNLLEIGIGGYNDPLKGGKSLRMWKSYFSKANIYGVDIYDKSFHDESRIKSFCGSQIDGEFMNDVINQIGEVEIIIDDGSHFNEHVIESFKLLFPKLKNGGIYVIEDTQTAYWEEFGGDSVNIENPSTSMNFLQGLVHCLNYQEILDPNYEPSYFDRHIVGIHFYHNMVFIYKGENDEPTTRK